MDLQLSEEQLLLQSTVRRFVDERVRPNARAWDRRRRLPDDVIAELASLGLMGILVPAEHGGAELGLIELALVTEALAEGDGSLALLVSSHNGLCAAHILRAGTDEQRRRYLPALASAQKLGAWALTEPEAGSDAGALATRATRDGDHWILRGEKTLVTQGTVAGVIVLFARVEGEDGGVTAFLIDGDAPGLTREPIGEKLGVRATDTGRLILNDVRVPDTARLGAVGAGLRDALALLDGARINVAALALGLGRGALAAGADYARNRKQFGKAIAEFQAIQFALADCATELDAAELLVWRAADAWTRGQRVTREAAMAKLFATEAAVRVTDRAIQLHGGYGYTEEFPVERAYRDALLFTIGEGTSEIQRQVIARQVLREP